MMIREHMMSRFDEIKQLRESELVAKRLAVKAYREAAAMRKTDALKKKAAVIKAKVAEVKEMKRKRMGTLIPIPKDRKIILPHIFHNTSHNKSCNRTPQTQLIPQTLTILSSAQETEEEPQLTQELIEEPQPMQHSTEPTQEPTQSQLIPETPIISSGLNVRDIKALRAAKARLAIARLAVTTTIEESSMVNIHTEGSAAIARATRVNEIMAERKRKANKAIETLSVIEEAKVIEVVTELKTMEASVFSAVEELKSVRTLIKRVKAIQREPTDVVEGIEHELEVAPPPKTIRWPKYLFLLRKRRAFCGLSPQKKYASRPLQLYPIKRRFRRIKKRKVLLYANAIPRVGLFKLQFLVTYMYIAVNVDDRIDRL